MGGDQGLTGAALAGLLEAQGYDFFTGVPCSMIEGLIATLETHPRLPYVPAVREDVAVGLAAGAWLAGRRPMVLMQNSGLGTSMNALVSLSLMYRLPALLLVTWRGHRGKDAPEHLLMGEISSTLLELLRIPHRILSAETIADDVAWGRAESERLSQPVALLLPPGILDTASHAAAASAPAGASVSRATGQDDPIPAPRISRFEALRAAVAPLTAEPVVHANGYICRESFGVKDRPENFYMIGSMGMASAIGLGVALAVPDRSTVVFDNALYGSTGNQASPSRAVGLHRIARAAGYERSVAVAGADEIRDAVTTALRGGGPSFILARVTAEEQPAPRIPYPPEEIRDRFRASCGRERR